MCEGTEGAELGGLGVAELRRTRSIKGFETREEQQRCL